MTIDEETLDKEPNTKICPYCGESWKEEKVAQNQDKMTMSEATEKLSVLQRGVYPDEATAIQLGIEALELKQKAKAQVDEGYIEVAAEMVRLPLPSEEEK